MLHVGRIPGFADDREVIACHVMQSVPDWIGRFEMPAAVTEHPGIGPCTDDFGNEEVVALLVAWFGNHAAGRLNPTDPQPQVLSMICRGSGRCVPAIGPVLHERLQAVAFNLGLSLAERKVFIEADGAEIQASKRQGCSEQSPLLTPVLGKIDNESHS